MTKRTFSEVETSKRKSFGLQPTAFFPVFVGQKHCVTSESKRAMTSERRDAAKVKMIDFGMAVKYEHGVWFKACIFHSWSFVCPSSVGRNGARLLQYRQQLYRSVMGLLVSSMAALGKNLNLLVDEELLMKKILQGGQSKSQPHQYLVRGASAGF